MLLTNDDKKLMISILRTLIYNNFTDLQYKINQNKHKLTINKYNLLLFGDKQIDENKNCRVITELENRWCLQSILHYHLYRTKKITLEQYEEIINV